jgi:4-amino-4-deoxy-L-arabinose transferase-like glycosyltransferase
METCSQTVGAFAIMPWPIRILVLYVAVMFVWYAWSQERAKVETWQAAVGPTVMAVLVAPLLLLIQKIQDARKK